MLPCDCELYAGDCRTVMLLPIVLAVVFSTDTRYSSWSDCRTVGAKMACVLPHSVRNVCRHCVKYVNCLCLSCTIVAMLMPVSTSIAVSTGMTCLSWMPLMYAKSHCMTGTVLVFCVG